MRFSDRILARVGLQRVRQEPNAWPATYSAAELQRKAVIPKWFFAAPYGQARGVDITSLRTYAESVWVQMCVNKIINLVSTIDWDIVSDDPKRSVPSKVGIAKEFFENPNANDEPFENVLRSWLYDILTIDAGVLVKVFDGVGNLREVWARDGSSFLKDVDRYGVLDGYWQYSYVQPRFYEFFKDNEIVYAMANPRPNSIYGWAPTQSIDSVVKTLLGAIDWNALYFEKNGVPTGLLSLLGMGKDEFDAWKAYWEKEVVGHPHTLPMVNVDTKFVPFTPTSRDMQFLEGQQWFGRLVAASFGIPPSELGFTETVNRATAEAQSETYKRNTIKPLLRLLEYHLNTEIIWPHFTRDVRFTFTPALDFIELERQAQIDDMQLANGLKVVNQLRSDRGEDPVPWGNIPWKLITPLIQAGFVPTWLQGLLEQTPAGALPAQRPEVSEEQLAKRIHKRIMSELEENAIPK